MLPVSNSFISGDFCVKMPVSGTLRNLTLLVPIIISIQIFIVPVTTVIHSDSKAYVGPLCVPRTQKTPEMNELETDKNFLKI